MSVGSQQNYRACCGPLHHGERQAGSAEELMRSRYSAYAYGDDDYLFRTGIRERGRSRCRLSDHHLGRSGCD